MQVQQRAHLWLDRWLWCLEPSAVDQFAASIVHCQSTASGPTTTFAVGEFCVSLQLVGTLVSHFPSQLHKLHQSVWVDMESSEASDATSAHEKKLVGLIRM